VAAEVLLVALLAAWVDTVNAQLSRVVEETLQTELEAIRLVQLAEGLEYPWAIAFLRGGGLLGKRTPRSAEAPR